MKATGRNGPLHATTQAELCTIVSASRQARGARLLEMAKSVNRPNEERPDVPAPADPQDAEANRAKARKPRRWNKLRVTRRKNRETHKRNIDPGL